MNAKLKIRRIEKRLSQKELAKKIGVTNQSISDYETGKTTPNYVNMQKIANILDAKVGELFFNEK